MPQDPGPSLPPSPSWRIPIAVLAPAIGLAIAAAWWFASWPDPGCP